MVIALEDTIQGVSECGSNSTYMEYTEVSARIVQSSRTMLIARYTMDPLPPRPTTSSTDHFLSLSLSLRYLQDIRAFK